jgi:polyisoprenoid-binding protein YceI
MEGMTIEVPTVGTYTLDPAKSKVTFAVAHMFGAGTVNGTFALTSGSVEITDPASESSVTAVVDAASIATNNSAREAVVRSAALLNTAKHPSISFESSAVSAADGEQWTVSGTLTAKSGAAPIVFAISQSDVTESGAHIVASAQVDRYAHGIKGSKGMVGRLIDITVDAHAVRDA